MAVRAVNMNQRLIYVPEDDPAKGSELETRFHLRPLRSSEVALVQDRLAGGAAAANMQGRDIDAEARVHQAAVMAVKLTLQGWDNFHDENDNPIEFKSDKINKDGRTTEQVRAELFDRLRMEDIFGMWRTLMDAAQPEPSARKN